MGVKIVSFEYKGDNVTDDNPRVLVTGESVNELSGFNLNYFGYPETEAFLVYIAANAADGHSMYEDICSVCPDARKSFRVYKRKNLVNLQESPPPA